MDEFFARKEQNIVDFHGEKMFLMHRDEYMGEKITVLESFGKAKARVAVIIDNTETVYEKYAIAPRAKGGWDSAKRREVFEHCEDILAR